MFKKWIALAMIGICCLSMAACGEEDKPTAPITVPPTPQIEEIAPKIGEEYTVDNAVNFSLFKVSTGDKVTATIDDAVYYENSHKGKTYVDVVMDVTNVKDTAVKSHELMSVSAVGKDDVSYTSVLFATEAEFGTELVQFEEVAPNETVRLHAAVEVEEIETALVLTIGGDKDTVYKLDYTLGETLSSATDIKIGGTVQTDEGNALTLVSVSFGGEVNPTNTDGYYSYYSVKDSTTGYVYAEMNILNNTKEPLPVSKAVGMTVAYPDGRVFNGFTVVEAEDQKGFVTDAVIEAGKMARVLYLVEIPTAPKRTEVDITVAFGSDEHLITIGIPATEAPTEPTT